MAVVLIHPNFTASSTPANAWRARWPRAAGHTVASGAGERAGHAAAPGQASACCWSHRRRCHSVPRAAPPPAAATSCRRLPTTGERDELTWLQGGGAARAAFVPTASGTSTSGSRDLRRLSVETLICILVRLVRKMRCLFGSAVGACFRYLKIL